MPPQIGPTAGLLHGQIQALIAVICPPLGLRAERRLVERGGLVAPRVRSATASAPTRVEIDSSRRAMMLRMAVEITDEPTDRPSLVEGVPQVGRQPYAALCASHAVRLGGHHSAAAAHTWGLGLVTVSHASGRERSRTAERLVRVGDDLWSALGAWPWACDPRADDGSLPVDAWPWWDDATCMATFRGWFADARCDLAADLSARARQLRAETSALEEISHSASFAGP
jgi:hypothetical protein